MRQVRVLADISPAESMATAAPKSSRQSQRDWEDRVKAWVERTCAEQGVPVKLSDPVALQRIADILGEARDAREAARKGSQAGVTLSWASVPE